VDVKDSSATQGKAQGLDNCHEINHHLDNPAASLRPGCTFVPCIAVEGSDETKADVGWKMGTYQLDHARNATLYAQ
jgi:hypothetical protein